MSNAAEAEAQEAEAVLPPPKMRSGSGIGFLIFLLGFFCGVPLAIFAPELISQYGGLMLAAIVLVLLAVVCFLAVLFILRQRIWFWLFRRGEIELSRFAGPLSDVARHAAERRVEDATQAARNFAELALARYAWVSTRRWLVASITGLIASIAALAGSALLFEQNKLLREQSQLLSAQNLRIGQQNELLDTQTQLAEAQRGAAIGPQIILIGEAIAAELAAMAQEPTAQEEGEAAPAAPAQATPGDFGTQFLSEGLQGQIVTATLLARPYRYLVPRTEDPRDQSGLIQQAIRARGIEVADDSLLDEAVDRDTTRLIERPLSPERGAIIALLQSNNLVDTRSLTQRGADFSYADLQLKLLPRFNLSGAELSFANFDWVEVKANRFSGAYMYHASFRNAQVIDSVFSADEASGFPGGAVLTGANLDNAVVHRTDFTAATGIGMSMRSTAIAETDFTDAVVPALDLTGALIVSADFSNASLQQMKLDGAIVFDPNFLRILAEQAAPGTFAAERWSQETVDFGAVAGHPAYAFVTNYVDEAALAARQPYRIVRMEER